MRILFVAMSQSIHTVRWTHQVTGRGWDLHLFPSWGYEAHPRHREITIHGAATADPEGLDPSVAARNRWPLPGNVLLGRAQRWLPWWFNEPKRLARLIARLAPDVVHSLEIQHAGYLTLEAKEPLGRAAFPRGSSPTGGTTPTTSAGFPNTRRSSGRCSPVATTTIASASGTSGRPETSGSAGRSSLSHRTPAGSTSAPSANCASPARPRSGA